MKTVFATALVAVLAGLVDAKASFTNSAFNVVKGQAFTLTWSGGSGPFTVNLKSGDSDNLKTVSTLASDSTGSSLTWTPDSTLTSGTYAFEIIDESDDVSNYSAQFTYSGASAAVSGSTATATSSGTSSSGSKSASSTVTSVSSSASSASSSSASKSESSSVSSAASSSASASTTIDSSTLATHTSSAVSKTSSAATTSSTVATTTTAPNTNDARDFVAPILGVFAAAVMAL